MNFAHMPELHWRLGYPYAVALIGRPTRFSIERARTQFGWSPRVSILDGVRETLDWYYQTSGQRPPAPTPVEAVR